MIDMLRGLPDASHRSHALPARGANRVGRFRVEREVANNDDLALARHGLLEPEKVRRETGRSHQSRSSRQRVRGNPSVTLSVVVSLTE